MTASHTIRTVQQVTPYLQTSCVHRDAGRVVEGHCCVVAGSCPVGNKAIFGVKDKLPAAEVTAVCVRDISRRTARTAIAIRIALSAWDGHNKTRILVALCIIESGGTTVIIGDPEVLSGNNRYPPGVHQLRSVVLATPAVLETRLVWE